MQPARRRPCSPLAMQDPACVSRITMQLISTVARPAAGEARQQKRSDVTRRGYYWHHNLDAQLPTSTVTSPACHVTWNSVGRRGLMDSAHYDRQLTAGRQHTIPTCKRPAADNLRPPGRETDTVPTQQAGAVGLESPRPLGNNRWAWAWA